MVDSNREGSLRLFVACELPPEVREALGAAQRELRSRGAPGLRYARPEGIHITLKFLGEVAASRVRAIEGALTAAVPCPLSLRLRPGELGAFGGRQGLRVVWIGLTGDTEGLARLASQVEEALASLGFPQERRPFAAHLTLARVRDADPPSERARLAGVVEALSLPEMPEFGVERVSLMQSALDPGGAIYRRLASFPAG